MKYRRKGWTLPEVILTLGIGSAGFTFLADLHVRSAEWADMLTQSSTSRQEAALSIELIRHEVAMAGRSVDGPALIVQPGAGEGGDYIRVTYRTDAHRSREVLKTWTLFAAKDGLGRWNLYGQSEGGSRQPWILGVRRLDVLAIRTSSDTVVALEAYAPEQGARAVLTELTFVDGQRVRDWLGVNASITIAGSGSW